MSREQSIDSWIGVNDEVPLALYVGDYQKGLGPTIQAAARVTGLHLVGVSRSPTEPYRDLIAREGVGFDRIHLDARDFKRGTLLCRVRRYVRFSQRFTIPLDWLR